LLGLTLFVAGVVNQTFAQSSVFTYQGRLQDGGVAANGNYDFRFTLWDASSGGTQQPPSGPVTVNLTNVQVTAGNFSVQLDFGATAFPGADRYLEMSVQLAGGGPFTTLSPRTRVTGTPYALRSVSAANADTVTDGSITSAKILDGTIVNADINAAAGIVDTKLATISTALKVSNSATTATSANTANAIVARDASGNFSAGTIIGNLTGNTSGSAASFTGSLSGDVTGTQGATVVSTVGGVTAANVASGANLANAATDANTASAIVRRDASGNFSAGTITAAGDVNLSTTNAAGTVGVINQNGTRLIHSFGTNNFFAGAGAGNFTMTGGSNTASGINALRFNTTGTFNTAIGAAALSANTSGKNNTANGQSALVNNTTGVFNTASGAFALVSNNADNNTAIGEEALRNNTSGKNNTAIGVEALFNNMTGSDNIAVGPASGFNLTGGNNIDIGNEGVAADSGIIRIGTSGFQTATFFAGIRGVTTGVTDAIPVLIDSKGQLGTISSSRRYKQDIKDMGATSSRLMALRPVTFRYLKPYANGEKPIQFGLIAEEVAETFPELVVRNQEGQPETVKYQDLTPLLLNELQKQVREVQKQAKTIAALQAQATNAANGSTTTNRQGEAIVTLPDNFVALSQDFRYQLTVVGQFAQAIVLQEVKGHQFKIKTDKPNVKVSWQVTAIRHDQSAGSQK
jgi:hypothetical protein